MLRQSFESRPELSFHKFKCELYNELMNTENAILGPNGALFIIQTEAEFQSTPGNLLHAAIPAFSNTVVLITYR